MRYPSDLADAEWLLIQPLLPSVAEHGRKLKVDMREVLNVIPSMAHSGENWRILPANLDPWQTVYSWFC